jgi:Flp pilus assembly protein TadD
LRLELDLRHMRARAHDGLARACDALGDADQARHHWRQALAIFTELGVPEAGQVRAQLDATTD